jgi:serine/threonine protein kinase
MNAGGPAGQLIDGRFELLEPLGGGGMGVVWRARDTMLQRDVALKEVRTSDQAPFNDDPVAAHVLRERVLREARALARLHHANVVTIFHIVDSAALRHPWLVMELVSGGSLEDRLKHGPLLPHEAARIGRGVLSALRAAHAAGIQHRDVKPANVLLRPDGTPVLTDFGIAALRESNNLTATGALIGSPEYIAPERIRGQEGDPASDLWSLGMLMYVAAEGHNPLRRDTSLATIAAVLDAPIPQPARSGPLTPVLGALLVRDPAGRPDAARLDQMLATAEQGAMAASASLGPMTPPPLYGSGYNPYGYGSGNAYTQSGGSANPALASSLPPAVSALRSASVPTHVPGLPTPFDAVSAPSRRRSTVFVTSVAVTALLGLSAALVWTLHGSPGSGPGAQSLSTGTASIPATGAAATGATAATASAATGSTGSSRNLLTAVGMHTFMDALRSKTGGTVVLELDAYPDYADVEVPTKADPTLYDDYTYRDGVLTADPDFNGTISDGQGTVNLTAITWTALPALLEHAKDDLGISHPTSEYIIIDDDFEDAPAVRVYVSDSYGGAYLAADLKGNITKTYPRNG